MSYRGQYCLRIRGRYVSGAFYLGGMMTGIRSRGEK